MLLEKGESPRDEGDYRDRDEVTIIYFRTHEAALANLRDANAIGCTGPNGESMGPDKSEKYPGWWYVRFYK